MACGWITQLISNGQATLDDIESAQAPFSRQFTDSSVALQELNLPKGTKLDLVLDRPLYLNQ